MMFTIERFIDYKYIKHSILPIKVCYLIPTRHTILNRGFLAHLLEVPILICERFVIAATLTLAHAHLFHLHQERSKEA